MRPERKSSRNDALRALAILVLAAIAPGAGAQPQSSPPPKAASADDAEVPPAFRQPTAEEANAMDIDGYKADAAAVKRAEEIFGRTYGFAHLKYAAFSLSAGLLFKSIFDFQSANTYLARAIAVDEKLPPNQRDLTGSFCTRRTDRNRTGREFCHGEDELSRGRDGTVSALN